MKPNQQPNPGPMGNTQGLVLPKTSPNTISSTSAPQPTQPPSERSWWQRWGSEALHTGLDVVGLIPVVGEVADGANALIYLAEGDKVNAALSAASMLPIGGQAATAAKWGKKGIDTAQAASSKAKLGAEVAGKAGRDAASTAGAKGTQQAVSAAEVHAAKGSQGGHIQKPPEDLAAAAKRDQVRKNKRNGTKREEATEKELKDQHPDASVQREQYLRDQDGNIVRDPLTGSARRVDHAVIKDGKVVDLVETTSQTADKAGQIAKENRILNEGGTFIRDRTTGRQVPIGETPVRIIRRD